MFTLLYHLQALQWGLPTVFMLGSGPTYFLLWCGLRVVTVVLPKKCYTKSDDFLYSLYQKMVLFFYENYTGVQLVMYGDAEEIFKKKENAIVICNHQSTVDWTIANMLAVRQGSIGQIRYILKDGLKYFPVYGFYFRQHSCIYVRRSGKFQHEKAVEQLDQLARSQIPFWMVIFPEGTRINRNNLEKSKEFARSHGLPDLDYLLTPRHKATQLCIERLHENTGAIYDVTAAYSDTYDANSGERINAPGLTDFLQGVCPKLHLHVKRIDIKDVPKTEEKIKEWLQERYVQKDKILSKFYGQKDSADAALSENGKVNKLSLKYTIPPFLFFAAVNAPLLATPEGRGIYWKTALFGTLAGWAWMTIRS